MKSKVVIGFIALFVVLALVMPSLGFAKKSKVKEAVYTGPMARQFDQTIALSNGVSATITIVADQSQEELVLATISRLLGQASQLDAELNSPANGDIVRINKLTNSQQAKISNYTFDLISKAKNLAALTNGWFDIVATTDKGFFAPKDYRKLKLDQEEHTFAFKSKNMQLDMHNIWPAYLTDLLMQEIVKAGYANAKVEVGTTSKNVGKDIYTPWTVSIGLQETGGKSQYAHRTYAYSFTNKAVAELTPTSFAAPLIDPKSKKEVEANFRNVTVFAQDAMTAQALAIALYTIGPKGAVPFIEKHPEIKVICVNNKGEFVTSKGLQINPYDHSANDLATTTAQDLGPTDQKLREKEELEN
ncbi:MAG: FAD:protein FMN transferase [Pseudomonadota bacterium]